MYNTVVALGSCYSGATFHHSGNGQISGTTHEWRFTHDQYEWIVELCDYFREPKVGLWQNPEFIAREMRWLVAR
jgi:hypothetical protein